MFVRGHGQHFQKAVRKLDQPVVMIGEGEVQLPRSILPGEEQCLREGPSIRREEGRSAGWAMAVVMGLALRPITNI